MDVLQKLHHPDRKEPVRARLLSGDGVLLEPPGAVVALKPEVGVRDARGGVEVFCSAFPAEGVQFEEGAAGVGGVDEHDGVLLALEASVFAALRRVGAREVREREPLRDGLADEVVGRLAGGRDEGVRLAAFGERPGAGNERADFGGEHFRRVAVERIRRVGASMLGEKARLRLGEEPVVGHDAGEGE